jgi:FdhD protein
MMGQGSASRPVSASVLGYDGRVERNTARDVAVEVPVNLVYGGIPHVVLMATPADLEDLALGFSLTEGIIAAQAELRSFRIEEEARGLALHIELAGDALSRLLARRRAMAGRTGCGICGVESLDQLNLATRVAPAEAVTGPAMAAALAALEHHQPLHAATRAVHAAGWFTRAGAPLLVREDVGRHNALDKMIGAATRQGLDPAQGFAVITSRCSYEMVEKAAIFGASTLLAISAPTSLAIERAKALGVRLIGVARADGALEFVVSTATEGAHAYHE